MQMSGGSSIARALPLKLFPLQWLALQCPMHSTEQCCISGSPGNSLTGVLTLHISTAWSLCTLQNSKIYVQSTVGFIVPGLFSAHTYGIDKKRIGVN